MVTNALNRNAISAQRREAAIALAIRLGRIPQRAPHAPIPQPAPRQSVTLEEAIDAIEKVVAPHDGVAAPRIRISSIVDAVCREFDIERNDLLSVRQQRHIVRARHAGMWVSRKLTSQSLPIIGKYLGGRDHTTVMNGVERAEKLRASDDKFAAMLWRSWKSLTSEPMP